MGQKVSPIGFRTGITLGWKSRWFAPKTAYGTFLVEDQMIRSFVDSRLNRQLPYAAVADVEIERTRDDVRIMLHTARPGLVIGPKGAEIERLREAIEDLINRKVSVNVMEIKSPELNAQLVGEAISEQFRRRSSFRRVMKQHCEAAMANGAKGVKIICSGRLGGAELARSESQILGSIPLQTLQANVDYGLSISRTTYGIIGIKVWIYKGMFDEAVSEEPDRKQDNYSPAGRDRRSR